MSHADWTKQQQYEQLPDTNNKEAQLNNFDNSFNYNYATTPTTYTASTTSTATTSTTNNSNNSNNSNNNNNK